MRGAGHAAGRTARLTWETRQQRDDGPLEYGDRRFAEATRFARALRRGQLRSPGLNLSSGATAYQLLRALPRRDVPLTVNPSGLVIEAWLAERRAGLYVNRIAQGILELPDDFDTYTRGRSKQALRTNLHRGERAGIRTQRTGGAALIAAVRTVLEQRPRGYRGDLDSHLPWWWKTQNVEGATAWRAITDEGDSAAALVTLDCRVALLQALICADYTSRWVLHHRIVRDLHAAGIRCLLTRSKNVLLLHPGTQEFQQRLGYTVAHLVPTRLSEGGPATWRLGDRDWSDAAPSGDVRHRPQQELHVGPQ